MATFTIEAEEVEQFISRLHNAAKGDFKKELRLFMEGLGMEFLRILQDEIIRLKVLDTRQLLASFTKGGGGNVWTISDGGLTLEVGTTLDYAKYVNDGHKQTPGRFIPGTWSGDRFVYQPGLKTGMVLKAQWVEGAHYWESALRIMEKLYPKLLERKVQEWLDKYFGSFA